MSAPPAFHRLWGSEGLIVIWWIDTFTARQKGAVHAGYERWKAKKCFGDSDYAGL